MRMNKNGGYKRGNKPTSKASERIVIEDKETKLKLIDLSEKADQSIKEIVVDLVKREHEKIGGN
jgi:hypothetical protein